MSCTAVTFTSAHAYEYDPDVQVLLEENGGYDEWERCGKPADDPIHDDLDWDTDGLAAATPATPEPTPIPRVLSFRERQDQALRDRADQEARTRRHIREILRLGRGDTLEELVTLAPGDYVAHVVRHRSGQAEEHRYTAIHGERTDNTYFTGIDLAMLHLIALRNGSADAYGSAAFYAARVLQVPEED